MQRFLTNYTFLPPSAFEVGTCTYTCLAVALRFVGLAFRLSSLSDSIARLLELFAVETNGFGESTSISLAGVVGIDGLLKREHRQSRVTLIAKENRTLRFCEEAWVL
jgi:hypothetical protein